MIKLHRYSSAHSNPLQRCNRTDRCFFLERGISVGYHKLKDHHFTSASRKVRILKTDYVDSYVPTFTPVQGASVQKSKKELAAIFGGAAVALFVLIGLVLLYFCLMPLKRLRRRGFVAESSFPSPSVERQRAGSPDSFVLSAQDANDFRQFTLLDLEHATRNFSHRNVIGEGAFGTVYKGLIEDGAIVAVKKRLHSPNQFPLYEMKHIARLNHKHLVKIVGFCEENHQQLLVNAYHVNGNVGTHLYDAEGLPIGKLGVLQGLLIAIGAAKGLGHLHSLMPPILHMHFRTSNVLVDENFTAKVSDIGIFMLLVDYNESPSSAIDCFFDPELITSKNFSARSDVYSFGVFLLELISGRKTIFRNGNDGQGNLILQAKGLLKFEDFVDKTIRCHSMQAMKQMLGLALACINANIRRPSMKIVVEELERIRREIRGSDESIEEIGIVTLGSELFSGSSSTGPRSPMA